MPFPTDSNLAEVERLYALLRPLCPCITAGPDMDGPEQACPLHGDGVTFVADVRHLELIAWYARAIVAGEADVDDMRRVLERGPDYQAEAPHAPAIRSSTAAPWDTDGAVVLDLDALPGGW